MAKPVLEPFVRQWAVLFVTYKRDGTPVGTPVNIAVEGERAFLCFSIRQRSEAGLPSSTLR